tara:strand:+ start:1939 stop:3714 length:1776 start_codon:yes stop_codon:yes gene_type:complete
MATIYDWSTTAADNDDAGTPINWAENQLPSTVNNSSRELMKQVADWRNLLSGAKISSGTNTTTLTTGLSLSAYAQGTLFAFEQGVTNTGAVTINVDSIGAKDIKKHKTVALVAGDLVAGGIYIIAYEATAGNFQLISPTAQIPATQTGTETLTNKTLTSPVINTSVSGSAFLDEDNFSSNSATKLASQQSIKVYVDAAASSVDADGAAASAAAALVSKNAAAASATTASTGATTATNYATKINGAVTGSDFSSKAWAVGGTNVTSTGSRGAAKEWATTTGAAVDTSEFSSKEYALGTTLTTGSSKQWALGGGSSFTEGTAVAGGVFSAKKYAANAAASASVAASGQIYSTVVNQTGASLSPALSADGTYYLCDTSSNNITVTMPVIGTSEGVKYAFQKTSASNSLIFVRSGTDTLNGSASNITLTDVNAQIQFVADDNSPDNWVGVNLSQITVGTGLTKTGSVVAIDQTHLKQTIAIACGDEITATAAATAVVTFHMPYAFTLTGVKAGVTTAPVGSVLTVDINEAGATVLTTKLTIDAGEKTSGTAATAPVIGGAGPALADNALMTIDVDGVGSGTAGAGLKVYLIGYAT